MQRLPKIFHDSRDTLYRVPFGAAEAGSAVTLRLDVQGRGIEQVYVRLWQEQAGETLQPMHRETQNKNGGKAAGKVPAALSCAGTFSQDAGRMDAAAAAAAELSGKEIPCGRWETQILLPEAGCLLWYFFIVQTVDGTFYYGNNPAETGGRGQRYGYEPPSFQITVYDRRSATPDWLKDAVIYQIFPDRFNRGTVPIEQFSGKPGALLHSNWRDVPEYIRDPVTGAVTHYDFFGGTLEGIREKLDYLADLGISCLYLNPVFESRSNHRYDTGNYKKIDPFLGTEAEFIRLCGEAREKGIRILLDGVFSHTGDDSLYFNRQGNYTGPGAFQSSSSPYFPWYRFTEYPGEYACWWGDRSLPEVKETEPSYLDYIIREEDSVLKHWLKAGISGWRLDVADELPEEFLKNFYQELKREAPEAALVGEVWEDASHKVSYGQQRAYLCGGKLDSVMNYVLRQLMLDFVLLRSDAAEMSQRYLQQLENYPKENMYAMLNLLGSHDVERILTVAEENLPQIPAGGEIGNGAAETESVGTEPSRPENRQGGEPYSGQAKKHWQEMVAERRLQLLWVWQMTLPGAPSVYYGDEAGIKGGKDPDNRRTYPWGWENRELQQSCRALIRLRRSHTALRTGRMIPVYAEGNIYVYARSIEGGKDVFGRAAEDETFFIALHRGGTTQTVQISTDNLAFGELQQVAGTEPDRPRNISVLNGSFTLTLPPVSGQVFVCRAGQGSISDGRIPGQGGDGSGQGGNLMGSTFARSAGILLHPTSLAGKNGLETLQACERFLDFLAAARQKIWQILPLNPPGEGNSPYLSASAFAGHPVLFTGLLEQGGGRRKLAKGYAQFCRENHNWLPDYALFRALKQEFDGRPWQAWPESLRRREQAALQAAATSLEKQIEACQWEQYEFSLGWQRVQEYAGKKGIAILGDMPIFVAADSADCWAHPEYFMLDEAGQPLEVAGVPPDYFSAKGQIWGNPLYRWDVMEKDGFHWWKQRLRRLSILSDIIRIDHFRGFTAAWAVDRNAETAAGGHWVPAPGNALFTILRRALPELGLVAEDLGIITEDVARLKRQFHLPGMRILQFHLHNRADGLCDFATEPNCIAYTGTHDNNTLQGWLEEEISPELVRQLEDMLGGPATVRNLLAYVYGRQAAVVIIPLQDHLALSSGARMNVPGTASGNWGWKADLSLLTPDLAEKIASLVTKFNRG